MYLSKVKVSSDNLTFKMNNRLKLILHEEIPISIKPITISGNHSYTLKKNIPFSILKAAINIPKIVVISL